MSRPIIIRGGRSRIWWRSSSNTWLGCEGVIVPNETKSCIACFETIDARARKCPHCHQVQTKVANAVNLPAVSAVALAICFVLVGWFAYVIVQLGHKEGFNSQLESGPARVRIATPDGHTTVSCFAPIRNKSDLPWERPSLQAEYFNGKKDLIDVQHSRESFSLYPRLTAQVRLSGAPISDTSDYASCKITVIDANPMGMR
jgi:hypothetical protein